MSEAMGRASALPYPAMYFSPGNGERIVTLTLNPAVDLASTAASVVPTHKIRTFEEQFDPGGGGINVARVLHILGADALALVLTGGITGRLVEELLDEAGVPWRALAVRGRTRICLNVRALLVQVQIDCVYRKLDSSEAPGT